LLDHFYTEFQKQSTLIDTRNNLDKGLDALSDRYPDSEPIPFSDSAIGLLVFADYVEIWSHSENSIHDRRLYLKKSEGWEEKIIVP
jgi:pyridoxine/pyridoxamine 5'-phosphate oxidase